MGSTCMSQIECAYLTLAFNYKS